MTQRDRMRRGNPDRDWASQVPEQSEQGGFRRQNQYDDEGQRWRAGADFGEQGGDWPYDRSQAEVSRAWEHERNRAGEQGGLYGQGDGYGPRGMGSRSQAGASRAWEHERNRAGEQGQSDQAGMAARGYDYGREMSGEPWRVPGPYSGRGPQGYRRSDERIKEDVCERLTEHGMLDASGIQIDVSECEVTLRGTVSDRRAKRMAEDVAESVSGVKDVRNELRIGQDHGGMAPNSMPQQAGSQLGTQQREAGGNNR